MALPDFPAGEVRNLRVSRSEGKLAFYLNGDRQPNDLYVLDLAAGGEPTQLTTSLNPAIDPADLVDSTVVRFDSFDGMAIPNILWKPHQATAEAPAPALVWVHGGPGGQTTRAHSAVIQYLANHGYVVLGINNRGSSGYGKTFFAADDGKHGREPLWDTVEAKKYLQSLDYVDDGKIGIIGGSYGGYMVLSALAFQPGEFKVGVNIFGVSNWLRTLESIPPYWESFREALYQEIGNPETQRDFLIETSPLFHADKINVPLMVLQGANDPRVIKPESDDIVAAVEKNGVPVEYVVFDDEGHGFSKKKNQIEGYGRILAFLDKHLRDGAATPPPAAPDADAEAEEVAAEVPEGPVSLAPRAIDARTAFMIQSMLRDVVQRGTGRAATAIGRPDIGGKTGSTNDYRDAWFSGFGGDLVTTVWVGKDDFNPLGRGEYGGRAALPIWIGYMRAALDGVPVQEPAVPAGVVVASVDAASGRIVPEGTPGSVVDYFKAEEYDRISASGFDLDPELSNEEAFDIF